MQKCQLVTGYFQCDQLKRDFAELIRNQYTGETTKLGFLKVGNLISANAFILVNLIGIEDKSVPILNVSSRQIYQLNKKHVPPTAK